MSAPVLEVTDLVIRYGSGRTAAARPAAVDRVSITIQPGQTVGLVGESGSAAPSSGCRRCPAAR
jgi:ABC-type glutathione transport system ATPase component